MSASVTLTEKFEIRMLKANVKSNFEGIPTSKFEVPFKILTESKFPTSNFKRL